MGKNRNNLRQFDCYEIDLHRKILWVHGTVVDLPLKAVELLCVLIEREGNVVSKGELLDRIWQDAFVEEGVLPQNVYLLRKTFKQHGSNENLIQTVPRRGYRFTGEWSEAYENGKITIEREVIEQSYETETELSEAEFGLIARGVDASDHVSVVSRKPDGNISVVSSGRRLAYFALLTVSVVLLMAMVGLYVGYRSPESGSAPSHSFGDLKYQRITASGRAFFAGLSPDDQHVAYVVHTADDKYSLVLHHLPTGSDTVIVAPQELHIFNLQFSPDGNHIYYSGQRGTKRLSVYRIPLYGGSPKLVTEELAHCFSLSPDGEWLTLYRRISESETHHLDICRSDDCSERRTLATRGDGSGFVIWGTSPSWSPDGAKLLAAAYTKDPNGGRAKRHLIEIDIASGKQNDIVSPEWHGVHQPYWTLDGKEIVLLVREMAGDAVQIWQLKYPSGEAHRITNDANDYREFRIASDRSFILAATWSKSENLFLVPVTDPSLAKQLTFDTAGSNGAWGIKWTPDGKNIVYTKASGYNTGNLWRLNVDTMENVQFTFDPAALPVSLDITPDGNSVVFSSNRTGKPHIWQINLDGTNLRQITDGEAEGHPEISPDGKWLYFGGNGLWKLPLEGGEAIRILSETPTNPRVSPTDPTRFVARYFDSNDKETQAYKIGLFNENDPTRPRVLNIPARVFEWKPDGSGIYYAESGESFGNIYFLPFENEKPVQITKFTDQIISNFSLSPDGSTFALSRGSAIGNVMKIDLPK